ncbi:MAG: hypothetical protein AB1480_04895 [Nitrospirota bacterium]
MEPINYLTDEEIIGVLRRIGIRQNPELDIAVAEYRRYWRTTYLASSEDNNNKDRSLTMRTSLNHFSFISNKNR